MTAHAAILGAALLTLGVAPALAQTATFAPADPAMMGVVSYRDLPFRSVVRQQYDYSCGSAALATLLRHHYGRDIDERDVFEAMIALGDAERIRRDGFSLLDMKRYLEAHGFAADGFRLTLDELHRADAPAIVMIDTGGYRHFVVLKGMDAARVLVGDPALGLKSYDREAFAAIWNGVAFRIRQKSERFNQRSDWWPTRAEAPVGSILTADTLASLTQQLPPLYQITTRFSLDPYLR